MTHRVRPGERPTHHLPVPHIADNPLDAATGPLTAKAVTAGFVTTEAATTGPVTPKAAAKPTVRPDTGAAGEPAGAPRIQHHRLMPSPLKRLDDMRADEAGPSSDQYTHAPTVTTTQRPRKRGAPSVRDP